MSQYIENDFFKINNYYKNTASCQRIWFSAVISLAFSGDLYLQRATLRMKMNIRQHHLRSSDPKVTRALVL